MAGEKSRNYLLNVFITKRVLISMLQSETIAISSHLSFGYVEMYSPLNISHEGKVLFVSKFKDIAIDCLEFFHSILERCGTAFCAVFAGD